VYNMAGGVGEKPVQPTSWKHSVISFLNTVVKRSYCKPRYFCSPLILLEGLKT
jgi:hypothetical protein